MKSWTKAQVTRFLHKLGEDEKIETILWEGLMSARYDTGTNLIDILEKIKKELNDLKEQIEE